ncbi:MAG: hypothetical protein Q4D86_02480 [Pasteurella oralis]|uniref:hypothetical protein n=1 Tax=Pasteurella oralis TaxID=1071947 RepID=UPI0026FBB15B|nr:hypothetical protein [Pasteurella oralis]
MPKFCKNIPHLPIIQGALPLKTKVQSDTPLSLASNFSSLSKFNKMFLSLTLQHTSPLDFMANLNNAATFQLTQNLAI